jgi:hypothetical protein
MRRLIHLISSHRFSFVYITQIVPVIIFALCDSHSQYTERTDGSYIEDKESAVVWHFEAADPEYGRMQAAELAKYLDNVSSVFVCVCVCFPMLFAFSCVCVCERELF